MQAMDGQGSVRRNIALKLKDSSSQKTTDTSRKKREGRKGQFPIKAHTFLHYSIPIPVLDHHTLN